VGVGVVEDVQRPLVLADLDREALAGLLVGDHDEGLVVPLAPEEPDVEPIVGAVIEFVEEIVHGAITISRRGRASQAATRRIAAGSPAAAGTGGTTGR
jgi:hypothetical protein